MPRDHEVFLQDVLDAIDIDTVRDTLPELKLQIETILSGSGEKPAQ